MESLENKNKYSYVFKKTFDLVFEKKYILMKTLLIPFIILTVIEYFSKEIVAYLNIYLLAFLYVSITIIMSVLVHRIFLLDSSVDSINSTKLFKISFFFFIKALGLGFVVVLFTAFVFFLITLSERLLYDSLDIRGVIVYSFIVKGLIVLFLMVLFSRLLLIFPSIAIEKPMGFSDAFSISSEYKLFVFLNIIVIPIVLGFIIGSVYGIAIGFLMGIISPKLSILSSLVNIFVTVFSIGFLSVTYEYIMGKKKEENLEEQLVLAQRD